MGLLISDPHLGAQLMSLNRQLFDSILGLKGLPFFRYAEGEVRDVATMVAKARQTSRPHVTSDLEGRRYLAVNEADGVTLFYCNPFDAELAVSYTYVWNGAPTKPEQGLVTWPDQHATGLLWQIARNLAALEG